MNKLVVFHRLYGCDTGCCGHTVAWFSEEAIANLDEYGPSFGDSNDEHEENRNFSFGGPYEDSTDEEVIEYAKKIVTEKYGEEHVKDLDWEHTLMFSKCKSWC